MDVCGCKQSSDHEATTDDEDSEDYEEEDDMKFSRTAEQHAAFKRLALELETDASLVTLAGWRPYTRPKDLRKTFVGYT